MNRPLDSGLIPYTTAPKPAETVLTADKNQAKTITYILVLFVVLIASAEALILLWNPLSGAILYSLIMIGLVNLYYFARVPVNRAIFLSLILLPLLRIISLVLSLPHAFLSVQYILSATIILISALMVARINKMPTLWTRMALMDALPQHILGTIGLPLGMIAYFLAPTSIAVLHITSLWGVIAATVIALLSGFVDEFVFRGILQNALVDRLGALGVLFGSFFYAAMLISVQSPMMIFYDWLIGLLFAFWVYRTKTLWGVIFAHGLLNFTLWVFFPLIRVIAVTLAH